MLIAEDLLLFTYDDETGRPDGSIAELDLRLAGAILLELALAGKVAVAGPDGATDASGTTVKKGRVYVVDAKPTGQPELDRALENIAAKSRKPAEWMEPLSRGLRTRLLEGLATRGVLQREADRVLRIFPIARWLPADAAAETTLRARLTAVLLGDATPTQHELALVALGSRTGMVRALIPKERRREAAKRAKELAESNWALTATGAAIDQAAFMAIMPAIFVSTVIVAASS